MSIVVFGSSARVGQGIIRQLYNSGKYQTIICADLFPNYTSIQRFLYFKQSLNTTNNKTKIVDAKVTEKSDLLKVFRGASTHVVYVTHYHFTNTASQLNLIQTTASAAKDLKKKLICVTPVECDHYGEADAETKATQSQAEARQLNPELNLVKSDLTFGQDSSVVSGLFFNIINNSPIVFQPSGAAPAPINAQVVAEGVQKIIESGSVGEGYIAQGSKRVNWDRVLNVIETSSGVRAQRSDLLQSVFSPLSNNLFSEFFYKECTRNMLQFVNQYQMPNSTGLKDLSTTLGLKNPDFEEFYQQNPIKNEQYKWSDSTIQAFAKRILY